MNCPASYIQYIQSEVPESNAYICFLICFLNDCNLQALFATHFMLARPNTLLSSLQLVSAARLITRLPRYYHISTFMIDVLNWLQVIIHL